MSMRPGTDASVVTRFLGRVLTAGGIAVVVFGSAPAPGLADPRDRTPLATPSNLGVTGTIPPSEPLVVVTEIGATHVSLAWSSTDDGPYIWYTLFQDGIPIQFVTASAEGTAYVLSPETTYTFTVQARDLDANFSPLSDPVVVTTLPANAGDTTPPTTPTDLTWDVFDNEISLRWSASTDDHDPQDLIRYDIHLNGALADIAVGGSVQSLVFGVNGPNLLTLTAVDTAGNASGAVTATIPVGF